GCTSGHGISGMAQLAVGSTIAVAAMFAGGIVVASLFRRA
ncbi:MAG: YeeE/YedE family protein, partial [Rhodospirillaceae bacterium]|nr:YeeE/YedE family protein [Rhodospirillaceae bacterium]